MVKLITQAIWILLTTINAKAQTKVANYAVGKPGTNNYEHFSFWTKSGERTTIRYAYGKERKEMKLHYRGIAKIGNDSCFKVQFPNRYTLFIVPNGLRLNVRDSSSRYNKMFLWEYEGPVNGIGTFCDVCAEDEQEAMRLVRTHYLK